MRKVIALILSIITMIVFNISVIAFSWCFKLVTDSLISYDYSAFTTYIIFSFVVVFVQAVSNYIFIRAKNRYVKEYMTTLKSHYIKAVFDYNISDFLKREKSDYLSFLFNDLNIYEQKVILGRFEIMEKLLLMAFSTIAISLINIKFITLVFVLVICSIVIPLVFGAMAQKSGGDVNETNSDAMNKISEMLDGFLTLRTFSCECLGINQCDAAVNKMESAKMRLKNLMASFQAALVFMTTFVTLIIFVWGGHFVINKIITVGELIALIQMLFNVAGPIMGMTNALSNIKAAQSISEQLKEYLSVIRKDGNKKFVFNNGIEVKNLSYKYDVDADYVIDDFCYRFAKGKKYALIGENGSGKSTFLKIFAGINDLNNYHGEIKIDGIERKELCDKEFWENVSYIPQDVFLFKNSLIENVFINGHIKLNKAFDSFAKKLDLLRYISNDSNGKADELSGGEKQKLVFLREMMKNSPVIIADEPDSALDIKTSSIIQDLMLESDKTCIVVTHKINSGLRAYDEIIVMEDGKIIESGNYDMLIEKQGRFFEMCIN